MKMRKIKFRAWDKQYKKWIKPSILSIRLDGVATSLKWEDANSPDQIILMQFTGLHDKSGREIWEGDIIRVSEGYEGDKWVDSWIGKIVFTCGSFMVKNEENNKWADIDDSDVEIIGNIYENPELLKDND